MPLFIFPRFICECVFRGLCALWMVITIFASDLRFIILIGVPENVGETQKFSMRLLQDADHVMCCCREICG